MGSLGSAPIPPWTGVDPLGGTPDRYQYTDVAWRSHPPSDDVSLPMASHGFSPVGQRKTWPLFGGTTFA
jgi:hypothetical protein